MLLHLDTISLTASKIWEYKLSITSNCASSYLGGNKPLYNREGYIVCFPTCNPDFAFPTHSYIALLDKQGRQISITSIPLNHYNGTYRGEDIYTINGEFYPYGENYVDLNHYHLFP